MKNKRAYRNITIYRSISLIILLCILFFQSCNWNKDGCHLTDEDKEWLLDEYDSLQYLKDGKDTIHVKVQNGFGQDEYDYSAWGRSGDNDYYGYSEIRLIVDTEDTIRCQIFIKACSVTIRLEVQKYGNGHFMLSKYSNFKKDSLISASINGFNYDNCCVFHDDDGDPVKELVFGKNYGFLKILTKEDILFELLPTE